MKNSSPAIHRLFPTCSNQLPLSLGQAGCSLLVMTNEAAENCGQSPALLLPGFQRGLALSMKGYFVAQPGWATSPGEILPETQFLLWQEREVFRLLVPLLDRDYRCTLRGEGEGVVFDFDCGEAGVSKPELNLAWVQEGTDPFKLVEDTMASVVEWMGVGKLRKAKGTPQWIDRLGWCTWDAFYASVDESKLLAGLEAFKSAGLLPGFVIFDDGWQDAAGKGYLRSFGTAPGKFTGDALRNLVRRCREEFGIEMVGCWRTLFGGMRGVDVESPGLSDYRRSLVLEPKTNGDTFGVVALGDVERFQDGYCAALAAEGIRLIKVDFQSALGLMTYPEAGRAKAASIWQDALQRAVQKHFRGEMLNCMAMASPEVYHTPLSNVVRSSDDFYPANEQSHPLHVRQNLFNALWLAPLQWNDWDMFQSRHPWALYHGLARAISGGPVYVSDRPGETDAAFLGKFLDAAGRVLRCPQPALPVREQLFADPMADKRLIRAANSTDYAQLLALFHPGEEVVSGSVREVVGEGAERVQVFSVRGGYLGLSPVEIELGPRGADLLVMARSQDGVTLFGLVDKWNPAAAILSVERSGDQLTVRTRCGGEFGFLMDAPIKALINGKPAEFSTRPDGLHVVKTPDLPECQIAFLLQTV